MPDAGSGNEISREKEAGTSPWTGVERVHATKEDIYANVGGDITVGRGNQSPPAAALRNESYRIYLLHRG